MAWISAYGCTSAAGLSNEELWIGLINGVDHAKEASLPDPVMAYCMPNRSKFSTQKELLVQNLICSLQQMLEVQRPASNFGIILASTKGFIDDVIWGAECPNEDSISPILSELIRQTQLKPTRTACISNACASSLSALFLARSWIEKGLVTDVILLAADTVGPFVIQGFKSLRVLSQDKTRPFSSQRSGFFLGEATAAILITKKVGPFKIAGVGVDAEGYAVTRPSQSGDSLKRAVGKAIQGSSRPVELIMAHGTATQVNDSVEDTVFYEMFFKNGQTPLITGSKWSLGHTLAVSGALDLILGCEIMRRKKIFSLANTEQQDPKFRCRYLTAGQSLDKSIDNFLLTSLGFGGIHASALIQRGEL